MVEQFRANDGTAILTPQQKHWVELERLMAQFRPMARREPCVGARPARAPSPAGAARRVAHAVPSGPAAGRRVDSPTTRTA